MPLGYDAAHGDSADDERPSHRLDVLRLAGSSHDPV